jgi:Na+-driven multidrug efflux pump
MRVLGVAMLPAGISIALTGVLQGSGATRTSLRITMWTTFLVQIPLALLLGLLLDLGALGVWLSFPLTFVARASVIYLAYQRGRWAVTGVELGPKGR